MRSKESVVFGLEDGEDGEDEDEEDEKVGQPVDHAQS